MSDFFLSGICHPPATRDDEVRGPFTSLDIVVDGETVTVEINPDGIFKNPLFTPWVRDNGTEPVVYIPGYRLGNDTKKPSQKRIRSLFKLATGGERMSANTDPMVHMNKKMKRFGRFIKSGVSVPFEIPEGGSD